MLAWLKVLPSFQQGNIYVTWGETTTAFLWICLVYCFLFPSHLECGGTIFGDAGSFKSPRNPSSSEKKDRDCIWILNRKKSKKRSKFLRTLTLTFNAFDVGIRNPITGECDGDYVEIREGKGFLSPFLTRLCGKNQPEPITTLSESFYVKFHTAVKPSGKEFSLQRVRSFFKMDGKFRNCRIHLYKSLFSKCLYKG